MRAVVLRSLAVIGIGAVLLAGVLYVASTVDRRAPTVTEITLTQPLPDEPERALITTGLAVEFTEPVDMASAAAAIRIEPAVRGSVSWSGSTMLFTPTEPLELATAYQVSVAEGVRDLAGNTMTELPPSFSFETAGPPEVVETVPSHDADDVPVSGPITVSFSSLMDTASVEAALRLQPAFAHELRWSGRLLEIVPSGALDPDREYEVTIGEGAFDVSGVALASAVTIAFRTVAPGLEAATLVPADGSNGIAPTSSIAVIFDRAIDPDSVTSESLSIAPDVAGSLAVVDANGEDPRAPREATVLRFTPSGALAATTTFEVALAASLRSLDGGGLAEPLTWTFTTGAPQATLSNQVTFLSDQGGVANLWAMNGDGTAARQLSTELTPVLDYAVAPDGTSFVVGDGRRLVLSSADGGERQVLTDDGLIEFDATYTPDGQRIAFARADSATGRGLGLWERLVDGGEATRLDLEPDGPGNGTDASAPDAGETEWLRAPRYSPDGASLAYIDLAGAVGVVDLESGEVASVGHEGFAPPAWLTDSSAILVTGRALDEPPAEPAFGDFVPPLELDGSTEVTVVDRSTGATESSRFGAGARVAALATDGRIAYLRQDGSLRIADGPGIAGQALAGLDEGETISAVTFAPGEDAVAVVILPAGGGDGMRGRIERIELRGGQRSILANEGWRPRWLP